MKGGKSKSDSKKADAKLAVKKGAANAGKKGSKKAGKDPNKPKRPASAFFVFMEEFRKKFNEENPNNKAVSAVGKAAGQKWKSMTDAEKAPYIAKADKRKIEYEKNMKAYNKKQASGANAEEEDESEKSMSEVNDDEDGDEGSEEEDDDE
ncbi:HMG1/2-like protein isoform X1 [Benincasa hispida]|uniref:HMG1/2-like protein isoform X1 n=1 Tax=Benincasa hispida TaxID=102211 RepID=UPI0018FF6614|nr:HMG1/2-like protein isoform X1 [Benincasa hispida]